MSHPRLSALPRLPHKPQRKKTADRKAGPSFDQRVEQELADLLQGSQDGRRCSSRRGMISTKLQGR
jgi:hypothetical protein